MTAPESIALMVKELRERRRIEGHSRYDFATRIGIKPATLTKLECGDRRPSLPTLIRWASALDMDVGLSEK